ncbi:MAG TPA: polymer-forming cytoskeletal protein [Longimicrobiales bacterium]
MSEAQSTQQARDGVISIIGPGMRVVGDCSTEGTLRVEGTIEGTVQAGKAVVVGKDGAVLGDVTTQDAVIGGRVVGTIIAESRLELQATCVIEGEVRARRIKLDEGGRLNGNIRTGDAAASQTSTPAPPKKPAAPPLEPEKAVATNR